MFVCVYVCMYWYMYIISIPLYTYVYDPRRTTYQTVTHFLLFATFGFSLRCLQMKFMVDVREADQDIL